MLALFAALPVGVVILAAAATRSKRFRAVLVVEALAIILFTAYLLQIQRAI